MIAINNKENKEMVEEFLAQIEANPSLLQDSKVIFRPYPGYKTQNEFVGIREKFMQYDWFIYDDSNQLSVLTMRDCFVLIGDYSSLTWTFPLTTLKPAILLFKDRRALENQYNGVGFFNPLIHRIASNVEEMFSVLETLKEYHNEKEILEYRKKKKFLILGILVNLLQILFLTN